MVAFIIIIRIIVYFCINFIVQNNVIDKGEICCYFFPLNALYIHTYIYITPILFAFFKMSHIKIKRKDIIKILSYI